MIYVLVLIPLIAISTAQRPTYAGSSPKGYPELASRFRDPADDQDQNVAVANRIGEEDEQPANLPTDARGDASLVNRLNQWPRENRPFWLLNSEHIEKHRHPDGTRTTQQNIQQGLSQGQQGTVQDRQGTFTDGQQGINGAQLGSQSSNGQTGQLQSRFGEPVGTETRTIRPLSQRGSFAGLRS